MIATHGASKTPASTPSATIYPPLELVTKPRVTTAELAHYTNLAVQTWRIKACKQTYPDGLRPIRVCGRLAWPTAGLKKLLGVAMTPEAN